MPYVPHSEDDVQRALEAIGLEDLEALFADLPPALREPPIELREPLGEVALLRRVEALAARDQTSGPTFLGGGVRAHFIPVVTPHLAFQSEFVTAYTPYQAEVSQGVLQATFEYQSMMCELTGLAASNASMYDGASSVAEAALLAVRQTRRERVLVSRGVHPETIEVLQTYLWPLGIELDTLELERLTTPVPDVRADVACVIVQNPSFVGTLEPMADIATAAHAAGALFVAVVDPLSLAVLASPAEYGADIAVGDGQTIGNPVAFGGPSFGFMVVTEPLVRQLPGRLVGQTTDARGRRGFVLTLQAREQHIRRSKAKSNICSNHQLTALMATINLAALGPRGLREMAEGSVRRAHQLAAALRAAGGDVVTGERFFNEFVLRCDRDPDALRRQLSERGVRAGVPLPEAFGLGHAVTLAATELTSEADIDALVRALGALGLFASTPRPEVPA
jgi:glycine dehydrogenase subunit 1